MNKTIIFPTTANNIVIPQAPAAIPISNGNFLSQLPDKARHAAEPIKNPDDVRRVCEYLSASGRLRDNMLFTAGVNLGYRCGDLLQLKWGHFLKPDGTWRDSITLQEDKTEKFRTVYPSMAVLQAASAYATEIANATGGVDLNNYVFRSIATNATENKPLAVFSVERILKEVINKELGINIKAGTHCMRKTFGYHAVMGADDRHRAIDILQKMFNHSSRNITLDYIGITDDEIRGIYQNMTLGLLNPAQCCGIATAMAV